jgi:hypothetical protein
MRGRIRSGLVTTVAAVGIGALVVAPLAPPPEAPSPPVHDVRLAAATAPPIGALPLAFIQNQFQYCSVICPYVVQGAVTVPIAAVLTPVTFLGSLPTTGSLLQSIGAAAASVTGAANDAATPLIENDVYRVVPKAFNNLEVAVVELINVGAAVFQPGELLPAVNTARERILAALNQPLPPPAPTETGARTLPQVLAVETIKVFSAIAFQAGELLLLGIVQTADAVAQELAQSGDPGAALAAGATQASESIATAGGIAKDAVDTAVANISASFNDPFPSATKTTSEAPAAENTVTAAHDTEPVKSYTRSDRVGRTDEPDASPQSPSDSKDSEREEAKDEPKTSTREQKRESQHEDGDKKADDAGAGN